MFATSRSRVQDYRRIVSYESFRFHLKKFDEMRCKLDSTENPRSFEIYPTPPLVDEKMQYFGFGIELKITELKR